MLSEVPSLTSTLNEAVVGLPFNLNLQDILMGDGVRGEGWAAVLGERPGEG